MRFSVLLSTLVSCLVCVAIIGASGNDDSNSIALHGRRRFTPRNFEPTPNAAPALMQRQTSRTEILRRQTLKGLKKTPVAPGLAARALPSGTAFSTCSISQSGNTKDQWGTLINYGISLNYQIVGTGTPASLGACISLCEANSACQFVQWTPSLLGNVCTLGSYLIAGSDPSNLGIAFLVGTDIAFPSTSCTTLTNDVPLILSASACCNYFNAK